MQINKPKLLGITLLHILFFSVVVGIASSIAQPYPKEALTWGLKAGVSVANLYGDDVNHSDVRQGFSGGLFFNYRFNSRWAVQPEVLFRTKGAELEPGLTGENGVADYDFGYLDIPVLAKYYIPAGNMLRPNIYAGPEVGFKLYGESNNSEIDEDLKDAEFGMAFGAGLDFNLGSDPANFVRTVGLNLGYTLGLTDIFDTPAQPEARNGALLAALSIGF